MRAISRFRFGDLLSVAGFGVALLLERVLVQSRGLYRILVFAGGLAVYGGADAVGANGFLAIFLAALELGNRRVRHRHEARCEPERGPRRELQHRSRDLSAAPMALPEAQAASASVREMLTGSVVLDSVSSKKA